MSRLTLDLAEIGALVGDPARANILAALMDGRALTAGELAYVASVAPQTASGHLAKLAEANLLALAKQGRHRYYRLASPLVGRMLEGILAVAAVQLPPRRLPPSRIEEQMRTARTCYDHIAGHRTGRRKTISAGVLPGLSRLERAAAAHRRHHRCESIGALPGSLLGREPPRHSRLEDHRRRAARLCRGVRDCPARCGGSVAPPVLNRGRRAPRGRA